MAALRAIEARAGAAGHALHGAERAWPETNCYLDLLIELLHALGRDPLPLLGVAAGLDWEADHFTFLKPSAADILSMTGVCVHELALWDELGGHVAAQLGRGAIPLVEVDAFFLPDTGANAYRRKHSKTTIGITALDAGERWLEYFHNAGLFRLEGDDCDGVLGRSPHQRPLFPFAELARVAMPPPPPARQRELARTALRRLASTRAAGNPIDAFAAALPALVDATGGEAERVNALCFNTTRQLGSAFGLLADHLHWLGADGSDAAALADQAKSLQFQLARAARRGRADPSIPAALETAAAAWARCSAAIEAAATPIEANGNRATA